MMRTPDLENYPYLHNPDGNDPAALAARLTRLQTFIHRTNLLPYKCMPGHRTITQTVGRSVWIDHSSCWLSYDEAPILMAEGYLPPDLHALGMSGVCWTVVDQAHSIYRPDTHMVLFTLPKYREQLPRIRDCLK